MNEEHEQTWPCHEEWPGACLPASDEESESVSETPGKRRGYDGTAAGLDVVKMYLREIRSIPLLTAEQEQELGRSVIRGDKGARQRMIESNLRLVIAIGKRYINRGLPFQDIIEEGNLGLIRAVDKFDPGQGCRFSTYATWWIRQSIERGIANQVRTIHLPLRLSEKITTYVRTVRRLTQELGGEPSDEEVAAAMRTSVEEVRAVSQAQDDVVSLNEEADTAEVDSPSGGGTALSSIDAWNDHLTYRHVLDALSLLSGPEQAVLASRYGLNGSEETSAAIGRVLGIPRKRLRQIELSGLQKLRAAFEGAPSPA